MSNEIRCRYSVVAVPGTFAMEQSEKAQYPRMVGKCRVVDGPEAGKEIPFSGSLSDKEFAIKEGPNAGKTGTPAGITFEALRALGWRCNDLTKLEGLGDVKADAVGKDHTFQGDNGPVNTIQYSFRAARTRPTLRTEDQKAFANKMKALVASTKNSIVTVTDDNRAPAALPAAVATTANPASTPATTSADDATALFR